MKNLSKSRVKFITIFTILILTAISINFKVDFVLKEKKEFKVAAYWDLTGTPIDIDDTIPSQNWSYTALNFDWCSGTGTWNDPYLIENVYIDGLNTSSCIRIRNSQSYFEIRNCTLTNSADGDFGVKYAGIHLDYTNNGRIHNNTCSFNNQAGIVVEKSINNTVWDCVANDNKDWGIAIYWDSGIGSDNNTVRECTAKNNGFGIHVYASNYARIVLNSINNSNWNGIDIQGITHNHTIIGNTISFSEEAGISLGNTNDCKVIGNRITECDDCGIKAYSCSNSLISDNNLTTNYWVGISLSDGIHNKIIHNFITDSYFGIHSINLNKSLIFNNVLQDFENGGMHIEDFHHSNILKNNISYCIYSGIEIFFCNNISLSENNVNHNEHGVEVSFSQRVNITNNKIMSNTESGIFIDNSNSTNIIGNTINYNQFGIYLHRSNLTYVVNNYLYCNKFCISELNCNGTVLENNTCVACPERFPEFYIYLIVGITAGVIFLIIVSIIIVRRKKPKM